MRKTPLIQWRLVWDGTEYDILSHLFEARYYPAKKDDDGTVRQPARWFSKDLAPIGRGRHTSSHAASTVYTLDDVLDTPRLNAERDRAVIYLVTRQGVTEASACVSLERALREHLKTRLDEATADVRDAQARKHALEDQLARIPNHPAI